jgi:hypothetical protein
MSANRATQREISMTSSERIHHPRQGTGMGHLDGTDPPLATNCDCHHHHLHPPMFSWGQSNRCHAMLSLSPPTECTEAFQSAGHKPLSLPLISLCCQRICSSSPPHVTFASMRMATMTGPPQTDDHQHNCRVLAQHWLCLSASCLQVHLVWLGLPLFLFCGEVPMFSHHLFQPSKENPQPCTA